MDDTMRVEIRDGQYWLVCLLIGGTFDEVCVGDRYPSDEEIDEVVGEQLFGYLLG